MVVGPDGTVEPAAACVAFGALVVGLRDASSGRFAIWRLSLENGEWTRVTDPSLSYVLGVGSSDTGEVLAFDAPPGSLRLTLFRGGKPTWVGRLPEHGKARVVMFDPPTRRWWLGGTFHEGGRAYLALRIDADMTMTLACAVDQVPGWFGRSLSEFTGLVVRHDRILATSVGSCDLLEWDAEGAGAARRVVALNALATELRPACLSAEFPGLDSSMTVAEYVAGWDSPVGLLDADPNVAVILNRSHGLGSMLLAISQSGVLTGRVDLPPVAWVLAGDARWTVLGRDDLDQPGEPARLEIIETTQLFNGGLDGRPLADGSPAPCVRVVSVLSEGPAAGTPLLVVDARRCIGDTVRELSVSRAAGRVGAGLHALAVLHAPTREAASGIGRAVGRQVALDPCVLDWRAEVPAEAVVIGEPR